MCMVNVCLPVCDDIISKINFIILIKLFFYKTQKSRQKISILRVDEAFKTKEKAFFIIYKELSLNRTRNILKIFFLEW